MGILENKVVVITGANSGVGAAAAKMFAKEGAKVVIGARRVEPLQKIEEEIKECNGIVKAVPLDISIEESADSIMQTAINTFGSLDILINNAGVLDKSFSGIASYDAKELERLLKINTMGTMNCIKAAVKRMTSGASIVNIASIGGTSGTAGATYVASKAAIIGITKHVALCYAQQKIRCNAICPGGIETPMMDGLDYTNIDMSVMTAIGAHTDGSIPPSSPEEVASAALAIACDLSASITGQIIVADHGASL